jgi:hypothetical protein
MGQIFPFRRTYHPSLILTFPQELIAVLSNKDKNFELTLAKTCKTLYWYYEQYYEKKTAVVLRDPQSEHSDYSQSIKEFQLHHGWLRLKFASIWDSQSSNCPVKILCLKKKSKMPKELDCRCIDAFVMTFIEPHRPSPPANEVLNASFAEKFAKLKSLTLDFTILGDDEISMISEFSLLGFISLQCCTMTIGHLKIFEKCTTLQEIQLLFCHYSDAVSIKLPSQLKRFKIQYSGIRFHDLIELDASNCAQLECL